MYTPIPQGLRVVNDTEAQVLSELFESPTGTEADMIRRSGLPQSTYLAAKRRLYERGIVSDRYIPNPLLFGLHSATFLVANPFAESARAVGNWLKEHSATAVAWSGRSALFAVLLHRTRTDALRHVEALAERTGRRLSYVEADLELPTVPCYFDFEGTWKSLMGKGGLVRYPRALGGGLPWGLGTHSNAAEGEALKSLVRRPWSREESGRPAHLMGPHTLPRSEMKLVQRGLVRWRVLPSFSTFPNQSNANVTDVVLVLGMFRKNCAPAELFSELTNYCCTFPFLYVTDGRKVLIGGLGTGQRNASPRAVQSIPETLERFLEEIEVFREPTMSIEMLVDHRYDRLF